MKLEEMGSHLEKIASGDVEVPQEYREPMTSFGDYVVVVKEAVDGTPWLYFDLAGDDLPVLLGGFLGLQLRKMDYDLAQHIANVLNEHVLAVTYTG